MLAKVAMKMIAFQEDKCSMKNFLSFISCLGAHMLNVQRPAKKLCIYEKTFGAVILIFKLLISFFENKEFPVYLFCIVHPPPMLEGFISFLFEK